MKELIKEKIREKLMGKDIIVTLPKNILWSDYEKELATVKNGDSVMNFKVNHFPKTNIGNKCYVVHNGIIKGWMKIVGMKEKDFECSTTGRKWSGKFIERSGPFHTMEPIQMKGFQGFRYFE